jgi:ATP-dependent protease ClpP protease subunit
MTYNTVNLCGEIDDSLTERVCRQLKESAKFSEEVLLYIDSPGGFSDCMQQIIETIKNLGVPVWGYVIGEGASAAFNIWQYCERRFVSRGASLLFHRGRYTPENNPQFAMLFWEPCVFTSEGEYDEEIYRLMSEKSGLSIDDIRRLAEEEFSPSPVEAVLLGLADQII